MLQTVFKLFHSHYIASIIFQNWTHIECDELWFFVSIYAILYSWKTKWKNCFKIWLDTKRCVHKTQAFFNERVNQSAQHTNCMILRALISIHFSMFLKYYKILHQHLLCFHRFFEYISKHTNQIEWLNVNTHGLMSILKNLSDRSFMNSLKLFEAVFGQISVNKKLYSLWFFSTA